MPDGNTDEARDALLAKAREAWKDDPALDAQALGDGSGGDSVSSYLRAYYQRLATEDLALAVAAGGRGRSPRPARPCAGRRAGPWSRSASLTTRTWTW